MLFNFKKFNKEDTKIKVVSLTFPIKTYKKIKEKNQEKLANNAKGFFHLLSEFGKLKKRNNEIKIIMLEGGSTSRTYDRHVWNISTIFL